MLGRSALAGGLFGRWLVLVRLCLMIVSQPCLRLRSVSFVVSYTHVHERRSAYTARSMSGREDPPGQSCTGTTWGPLWEAIALVAGLLLDHLSGTPTRRVGL